MIDHAIRKVSVALRIVVRREISRAGLAALVDVGDDEDVVRPRTREGAVCGRVL